MIGRRLQDQLYLLQLGAPLLKRFYIAVNRRKLVHLVVNLESKGGLLLIVLLSATIATERAVGHT